MILYHAADLLWASKIKTTAESLGVAARPVRTVEMLTARLADSPVRALLVDLDAEAVALALLECVKGRNDVRKLAYGPHVQGESFLKAKAIGAAITSRGSLNASLEATLVDLDR